MTAHIDDDARGELISEAFARGGMQGVAELDPGFDPYIPDDDRYGDPDDLISDAEAQMAHQLGDPWETDAPQLSSFRDPAFDR